MKLYGDLGSAASVSVVLRELPLPPGRGSPALVRHSPQGGAGPKGYLAEKIIHMLLSFTVFVSFSLNGILAILLRDEIPVLLTNPRDRYFKGEVSLVPKHPVLVFAQSNSLLFGFY